MGEYDKPWTVKKDPRMLWDKVFFIGLTIVGLGIGAYIIYSGWASVENPPVSIYLRSFPAISEVVSRVHLIPLRIFKSMMKAMLVADNPTDIEPFSTASFSKMISLTELTKMTGTMRSK